MKLDHLALTANTLEEGRAHVEDALGVALQPGGKHPLMGTHNLLLGTGAEYFEVIAIDPDAPTPERMRWFDMDRFQGAPRLTNWIVAVDDIEAARAAAPDGIGKAIALSRGDLAWSMLVPDNGQLPFDACHPALIAWSGDAHPAARLEDKGVRLTAFEVSHPGADQLKPYLLPLLSDRRITLHTGARGFRAEFSTPHGTRELTG